MKKIFLLFLFIPITLSLLAQSRPRPITGKSAAQPMTPEDSLVYALGASLAYYSKKTGQKVNPAFFNKAVNEVMNGKQPLMNEAEAFAKVKGLSDKYRQLKMKPTIDSGIAFLEKNKTRAGVKVTASHLQYEVLTEGTGRKPTKDDTVICHYRGTLINGMAFDSSYGSQPIEFPVRRVIAGWIEGLQLMPAGSKYRFYIPHELAYGLGGYPPLIPGGAALVFDIELLEVKRSSGNR